MTEEFDEVAAGSRPSPGAKHLSRRAMGLGAVWSVPVILTAVAAPAAAASVALPAPPAIGATATGTKEASSGFGVKHVNFALTLRNTGAGAATVQVLSVTSSHDTGTQHGLPTTVVVPASGSTVVNFSFEFVGNAGTADYTITYQVSGVGTSTLVISV